MRSKDGQKYSLGRFIQITFDASPALMVDVQDQARDLNEVLKVNTNKINDKEYIDSVMKRLNQELSPFRDPISHDEDYIRAMWTKYTQLAALRGQASNKEIKKDLPRVAAFVKQLEVGPDHEDFKTLDEYASGNLTFDDK